MKDKQMKTFIDRVFYGMILTSLTGVGILFLGAVPFVTLFGGFSNKSSSMWDSLASVGWTFIVGAMIYAVIAAVLISHFMA